MSDSIIAVERIEIEAGGLHPILKLIAGKAVLRILLDGDRIDELADGLIAHSAMLEETRDKPERLNQ